MQLPVASHPWPGSGDTQTWPECVRVRVRPSVFHEQFRHLEFEPFLTIAEIVARAGLLVPEGYGALVWIGDRKVPAEWHGRVRPKPGALVNIAVMPQNARMALLIGGTLAIAVTAGFAGPLVAGALGGGAWAALGGALAAGAIAVGGTLALNALVPAPGMDDDNEGEAFERLSIGSASNRMDPYGLVPVVCGQRKVTSPLGARSYKSIVGGRLHSNFLLAISVGPVAISEPKFGDTSIFDFDEVLYQAWEGHPGDPFGAITLFHRDIIDDLVNQQLTQVDGPIVRSTASNAMAFKVILYAPSGPYFLNSKGEARAAEVMVRLEYRLHGTGGWTHWTDFKLERGTATGGPGQTVTSPRFWEFERAVPAGDYEVQVTRLTPDNDDAAKRNTDISWLSLQTTEGPVGTPDLFPQNMAMVAIRVRDQGALGNFNCIATSYAPVFSGSVWQSQLQLTGNPASIFRRVLQSKAAYFTVPDSDLDLEALGDWYAYCQSEGLRFDGVIEREQPVAQQLNAICTAGNATLDFVDGKYSVIIDRPSLLPATTLLTPRNMADFEAEIDYEPVPQVLRVRFTDAFNGWEPDERLVFDDGYNESNADYSTALVIDLINSVTNEGLAWRHGRRWLAHRRLRRERVTGRIGLEHVMLQRGQKVLWQHWASIVGLGEGRVLSVQTSGANITGITVDNHFEMESGGGPYGVRIRSVLGSNVHLLLRQVVEVPGIGGVLTFTTPFSTGDGPSPGDLVAFGRLNAETSEMIVLDRSPTVEDATIVLTHAAPGLDTAHLGEIPPWNPNVTTSSKPILAPAQPTIISLTVEAQALVGHPDVLRQVSIVVQVAPTAAAGSRPVPIFHVVRLRASGSTENWRLENFPGDSHLFKVGGVADGTTYQVQVQALGIARNGQVLGSTWSAVRAVTVPRAASTPATLSRIRNLELSGQGLNVVFTGRSPTFRWTLSSGLGGVAFDQTSGALNSFVDPSFGYYEVSIFGPQETLLRRIERTHEPSYTYSFTKNLEDTQELGHALPTSTIRIEVRLVDTFQHRSEAAILVVINPAPDEPGGLQVVGGLGTVFVSITRPLDGDFAGMIVWASSESGFAPQAGLEVARTVGDIRASFNASGPTFVKVAAYDEFRDDPAVLNISSEVMVTPLDPTDIAAQPFFQFGLLRLSTSGNTVSWLEFDIHITNPNGTFISEWAPAGSATWNGQRLFLYYQRASGMMQVTTDITVATGIDRTAIAVYDGGTNLFDLNASRVKALAADMILAGTIGAGLIATDHAVITQSAQIAAAIINQAHIQSASINSAHIQNAAIQSAHVGFAAIGMAHIAELSVDIFRITGNAVDTFRLTSEAAAMARSAFITGGGTVPTGYASQIDVAIVTRGGLVTITFSCQIGTGTQNAAFDARLLRDGAAIVAEQNVLTLPANAPGAVLWTAVDTGPPGMGTFATYTVQLRATSGVRSSTHKSMQVVAHR